MPINSRAKGSRTERELSHKLHEVCGWTARRTAQACGKFGDSDVVVPEIPRLLVESKAVERLNVVAAMARASEDAAASEKLPMLCHKRNRTEWLVTVRLADLPEISRLVSMSIPVEGSDTR